MGAGASDLPRRVWALGAEVQLGESFVPALEYPAVLRAQQQTHVVREHDPVPVYLPPARVPIARTAGLTRPLFFGSMGPDVEEERALARVNVEALIDTRALGGAPSRTATVTASMRRRRRSRPPPRAATASRAEVVHVDRDRDRASFPRDNLPWVRISRRHDPEALPGYLDDLHQVQLRHIVAAGLHR